MSYQSEQFKNHLYAGNYKKLKNMVDEGFGLNSYEYFTEPLAVIAAIGGYCDIIKYFHESGVDINEKDKRGRHALFKAIEHNKVNTIKTLIGLGININLLDKEKLTPLHIAAKLANYEASKMLLENGADANIQGKSGFRPIDIILHIENGDYTKKIFDLFFEYTDMHVDSFMEACLLRNKYAYSKYIESGFNIDQQDNHKCTALLLVAASGDFETTKYLVQSGANITIKDEIGNSAIDAARFNSRDEIAIYLEKQLLENETGQGKQGKSRTRL